MKNGAKSERQHGSSWKATLWLVILLGVFAALQALMPLRTAVQIGADEGFELAKATLCLHGYKLYAEVWNDQPPLHTFLITQLLKHGSLSVLGPRLVTSAFTGVLLTSLFLLVRRATGLATAGLVTAMVLASPGFLELSASCMLEIPALATAVAGLCVVVAAGQRRWNWTDCAAGVLFGLAVQMKLINLVWTPLVALVVCVQQSSRMEMASDPSSGVKETAARGHGSFVRDVGSAALSWACLGRLVVFGVSLVVVAVAVDFAIEGGAYLANFHQSWQSHFGAVKSYEYGSPEEHLFEWTLFLRNWDTTLLAGVGIGVILVRARWDRALLLPVAWLGWALFVFTNHKPWWSYYYVHLAIPICWCAALGITALSRALLDRHAKWKQKTGRKAAGQLKSVRAGILVLALYGAAISLWMGSRVYLQIVSMRELPRTFSSLAIAETARYKPFTHWLYTDDLAYSFHADIPMVPSLAVVPLKRLWSGDMTAARVAAEVTRYRPGLVLLWNKSSIVPFQQLLDEEYRLVYQDSLLRLYARPGIIRQAETGQGAGGS